MTERVVSDDVGPRGGTQNPPRVPSPELRPRLVTTLPEEWVSHIEAGSFVSPKAVAALAGTDAMVAGSP